MGPGNWPQDLQKSNACFQTPSANPTILSMKTEWGRCGDMNGAHSNRISYLSHGDGQIFNRNNIRIKGLCWPLPGRDSMAEFMEARPWGQGLSGVHFNMQGCREQETLGCIWLLTFSLFYSVWGANLLNDASLFLGALPSLLDLCVSQVTI